MELQFTAKFQKDYKKLPLSIQRRIDEKIKILASNAFYPSLRVKKVKGRENVFEASITMQYRLIFLFGQKTLVLLRVGLHDILNK